MLIASLDVECHRLTLIGSLQYTNPSDLVAPSRESVIYADIGVTHHVCFGATCVHARPSISSKDLQQTTNYKLDLKVFILIIACNWRQSRRELREFSCSSKKFIAHVLRQRYPSTGQRFVSLLWSITRWPKMDWDGKILRNMHACQYA